MHLLWMCEEFLVPDPSSLPNLRWNKDFITDSWQLSRPLLRAKYFPAVLFVLHDCQVRQRDSVCRGLFSH